MTRRVALGLVVVAAVAACGGHSSRDQVDAYVKAVNGAQASSASAFRAANRSYTAFIRGRLSGTGAVRRLRAAESSIRLTEARLARLPAPAAARGLRAKLLRVYRMNAELARETALLAGYGPARNRALLPLASANRRLSRALRSAAQPTGQAAAFAAYSRRLDGAITAVRRLKPPPVAAAANREELTRLIASRRLSAELRAAILARDASRTARLVVAFRQLGKVRAGERAVQAHELAAYTARRRAVARAVGQLQRERGRLDRSS
ncbi:MAG: hypothetical protein QOK21_2726 [Solirubrobacteraceae bacterium]|jgi:hypothetical protein|nr:hypothetical protein [Solirubrobacteraceae bacterium]